MKRGCSAACLALLVSCVMICADSSDGRQLPLESCVPGELKQVTVVQESTNVNLIWARYGFSKRCTKSGGRYAITVNWKQLGEKVENREVEITRRQYRITDLKPWTPLTVNLSVVYIDANKEHHWGPQATIETETTVGEPSEPRNFKRAELKRAGAKFAWEDPEVLRGPLDGFVYKVCKVHSCDAEEKCTTPAWETAERHELTVTHLEHDQHYRVEVAAYNILRLSQEKMVGNFSSTCFQALAKSPFFPEQLRVKCSVDPNGVAVTWRSHPDGGEQVRGYSIEAVGNSSKLNENIDPKSICQEAGCKYSLNGLKGGVRYQVSVIAKGKNPDDDDVAYDACMVPESAPPVPSKEIKLIYDTEGWAWVTVNETRQAFEFPADIFSDVNGNVTLEILLAQDSEIGSCSRPVDWTEANYRNPVPCYRLSVSWVYGDTCRRGQAGQRCILGTEHNCEGKPLCNGPLKPGVKYGLILRGRTRGGATDSKPVFFTAGSRPSPNGSNRRTGEILTLISGILLLSFFWRTAQIGQVTSSGARKSSYKVQKRRDVLP